MSERPHGARTLLRCYSWLRPYWPRCLGGLAGMLAVDALNLLAPQLIRAIIDRGIAGRDLRLTGLLAGALVGLALVRGIFTFFQGRLIEQASQGVAYDLRNALQDRLAGAVVRLPRHARRRASCCPGRCRTWTGSDS